MRNCGSQTPPDAAGTLRLCIRCKAERDSPSRLDDSHKCHGCKQMKPWREYSPIVLKVLLADAGVRGVAKSRKLTCEQCQYPACATPDCKGVSAVPPPHNARGEHFYCPKCRSGQTLQCSLCSQYLARAAFSEWMQRPGRSTPKCMNCLQAPKTTCTVCQTPAPKTARELKLVDGLWYLFFKRETIGAGPSPLSAR